MGMRNKKPRPTPPTPAPPVPVVPTLDQIRMDLLKAHNAVRSMSLKLNTALNTASQAYAQEMAGNGHFDHVGVDGSTDVSRARKAGFPSDFVGENIEEGSVGVADVMGVWMNSPGHRTNIVDLRYEEVGFGKSGPYWVALFGSY